MQSIIEYQNEQFSYDLDDYDSSLGLDYDEVYSKSPAIPMPKSHIHRTESEINLSKNMELAEIRDECMFNRLVSGIKKQQTLLYNVEKHKSSPRDNTRDRRHNALFRSSTKLCQIDKRGSDLLNHHCSSHSMSSSPEYIEENERSIENIISTRCASMQGIQNDSPPNGNLITEDEADEHENDFGQVFDIEI